MIPQLQPLQPFTFTEFREATYLSGEKIKESLRAFQGAKKQEGEDSPLRPFLDFSIQHLELLQKYRDNQLANTTNLYTDILPQLAEAELTGMSDKAQTQYHMSYAGHCNLRAIITAKAPLNTGEKQEERNQRVNELFDKSLASIDNSDKLNLAKILVNKVSFLGDQNAANQLNALTLEMLKSNEFDDNTRVVTASILCAYANYRKDNSSSVDETERLYAKAYSLWPESNIICNNYGIFFLERVDATVTHLDKAIHAFTLVCDRDTSQTLLVAPTYLMLAVEKKLDLLLENKAAKEEVLNCFKILEKTVAKAQEVLKNNGNYNESYVKEKEEVIKKVAAKIANQKPMIHYMTHYFQPETPKPVMWDFIQRNKVAVGLASAAVVGATLYFSNRPRLTA